MRLELVTVRRRPDWPAWAVGIVVAWLTLIGVGVLLGNATGHQIVVCTFKRLTGLPCPTCGATRATLCLLHGDVWSAMKHNPLLFAAGIYLAAIGILRLGWGRALRWNLGRLGRRAALTAAVVLILVNWAYLVICGG
jgi:hypothetical protein